MSKVGMISLGCSKNQIDAEKMLYSLKQAGFELTPDISEADAVIVNTCGFIEDAKKEAIENIIEAAAFKTEGRLRALIVTGCLAERYREEIKTELPEVDAVVGIGSNGDIVDIVRRALSGDDICVFGDKELIPLEGGRVQTTPFYTAYLKIAEGCDNRCTYCAIPAIRGCYRSRTMENIEDEARTLVASGVKELVLVAQDTTAYGTDIYGKQCLPELMRRLCALKGLVWLRTLYTYPERIDDELIDTVAGEEKIVKYFDIPIQHCNDGILKRMNRKSDKASLMALIEKLRRRIPDVTIRTTLITGFPGEGEKEFTELCEFVEDMRFDRLGCFAYSEEEGTPAALMKNRVPRQTRVDRAELIMDLQSRISAEKNAGKRGKTLTVLVEGYDDYIKCWYSRSAADAPEVDGKVFFTSRKKLCVGDMVKVKINDTIEYDLLGEMEE